MWRFIGDDRHLKYPVDPVLVIRQMGDEHRMLYHPDLEFTRIDMNPRMQLMHRQEIVRSLHELAVFKPWAPESQEIIVEPATVATLLDQIKKMQSGDLAEIRERNRRREARDQNREQVVAQVIALAA